MLVVGFRQPQSNTCWACKHKHYSSDTKLPVITGFNINPLTTWAIDVKPQENHSLCCLPSEIPQRCLILLGSLQLMVLGSAELGQTNIAVSQGYPTRRRCKWKPAVPVCNSQYIVSFLLKCFYVVPQAKTILLSCYDGSFSEFILLINSGLMFAHLVNDH